MATIKEIRKELIGIRAFLISQKAGFTTAFKTHTDEGWYKYSIENSDRIRERINKLIEMLDAVTG